MTWNAQQERALSTVARWMRDAASNQVMTLFGPAGTGKTTLAKHLVESAPSSSKWLFAAFTGKAAHVLRQKGCRDASTIHSLIYRPAGETLAQELTVLEMRLAVLQSRVSAADTEVTDADLAQIRKLQALRKELLSERRPRFALWANSPLNDVDVAGIVVDEVSMVDERLGLDLESFGKKILVLGDPAQLPPVGASGFYTKRTPDIMLTEIHRQARESGILRLATLIREGGSLSDFQSSDDCIIVNAVDRDDLAREAILADQVLVGRNETRRVINKRHRELIGMEGNAPSKGDRLVCLRNEHRVGLYNGGQWLVEEASCDEDTLTAEMRIRSEDSDGTKLHVDAWLHHMLGASAELDSMGKERRDLSEFDYSYALTVHKAQGSQWNSVLMFDQSASFRQDARKWLYTGITRAAKKLQIVSYR